MGAHVAGYLWVPDKVLDLSRNLIAMRPIIVIVYGDIFSLSHGKSNIASAVCSEILFLSYYSDLVAKLFSLHKKRFIIRTRTVIYNNDLEIFPASAEEGSKRRA